MRLDSNVVYMYVSAAQLVLQPDFVATTYEQRLIKLNQKLPRLRQLLSCAVCLRLLSDPYAPREGRCYHNVCRLCVRGRKRLQPVCNICKDYQDFKIYDENRQMRRLMLCFKSLCEHMMASTFFPQLSKAKPTASTESKTPAIPMPNLSTQEVVLEGASYEDALSTFVVDLPRQMPERLARQSAESTIDDDSVASSSSSIPVAIAAVASSSIGNAAACSESSIRNSILIAATAPVGGISAQDLQVALLSSQTQAAAAQSTTGNVAAAASSTPTNGDAAALTSTVNLSPFQAQNVTIQQLRNMIDLSAMVQMPNSTAVVSSTNNNNSNVNEPASSSTSFTLFTANQNQKTKPNQMLPNVKGGPNVPLTIASSKWQNYNRNWSTNMFNAGASSTINNNHNNNSGNAIGNGNNATNTFIKTFPNVKDNKMTFKRKTNAHQGNNVQRQNPASLAAQRRGCCCGNASKTQGNLTCCGQRCRCYVQNKPCSPVCRCYGCRNPNRPGGVKLTRFEQQTHSSNVLHCNQSLVSATGGMDTINHLVAGNIMSRPQMQQQQQQQLHNATDVSTSIQMPSLNYNPSSSNTAKILQIETLPPESVVIQSLNGKYQLVNLMASNTVVASTPVQANAMRINGITGAAAINNMPNINNTFIIPTVTNATNASSTISSASVTSSMPQLILHQPPPQLRRNNYITVQSITHTTTQAQSQMPAQTVMPLNSPIIVTSQSTFVNNVYPDSSERSMNRNGNIIVNNNNNNSSVLAFQTDAQLMPPPPLQQQQQQSMQSQLPQPQSSIVLAASGNNEQGADSTTSGD